MKALLLSNLYPSSRTPTRGVFNRHVFGAIAEHCDVRVVSPLPWWTRVRDTEDLIFPFSENWTGLQAAYPVYWSVPGLHRLHAAGMYYSLVRHLERLRKEFPFDVILSSWAYPDTVAAAKLARRFEIPFVANVLGSDINALSETPALRDSIIGALNESSSIISVSGALKNRLIELGASPQLICVQHNGVDLDKFRIRDRKEARRTLKLPEFGRRLVYVGNFVEEKGVEVLAEAFSRIDPEQASNLTLSFVGGGPLESKLREIAARPENAGRMEFHGRRSHDEIPLWMNAADLFCLPSFREGCPNVVLEALASGTPVVASNVGGVPEILTRECGELAPAGDPVALACFLTCALERDWDQALLRDSVAGRSWNDVGDSYFKQLKLAHLAFYGTSEQN